jgi:hypothetical protein
VRDYYEARAGEYDDWWLGEGLFAERERPCWFKGFLRASLPAARAFLPSLTSLLRPDSTFGELRAHSVSPRSSTARSLLGIS